MIVNDVTLNDAGSLHSLSYSENVQDSHILPPPNGVNGKPCDVSNIEQFDGNITISESESSSLITAPIRRDKITSAVQLPAIATYNKRSLFPKLGNVKINLLERGISLGFFYEIWQKAENKKHALEIENMLESEGLKYISTPRPRGWGGAAIIVNQEKFVLEKLNVVIPHNLEVVWGLVKTEAEDAKFKRILVCSFLTPSN